MEFRLKKETLDKVLQFLSGQPYAQVAGLIQEIFAQVGPQQGQGPQLVKKDTE